MKIRESLYENNTFAIKYMIQRRCTRERSDIQQKITFCIYNLYFDTIRVCQSCYGCSEARRRERAYIFLSRFRDAVNPSTATHEVQHCRGCYSARTQMRFRANAVELL